MTNESNEAELQPSMQCPLQASPHQAIFQGPFSEEVTVSKTWLRNVSQQARFCVNVKLTSCDLMSTKPRCFFIDPGQQIEVSIFHKPFLFDKSERYNKQQIGFFYTNVPAEWSGSAVDFKKEAKANDAKWCLCRMRVKYEATDEDGAEAYDQRQHREEDAQLEAKEAAVDQQQLDFEKATPANNLLDV